MRSLYCSCGCNTLTVLPFESRWFGHYAKENGHVSSASLGDGFNEQVNKALGTITQGLHVQDALFVCVQFDLSVTKFLIYGNTLKPRYM